MSTARRKGGSGNRGRPVTGEGSGLNVATGGGTDGRSEGDYISARMHLEQALSAYEHELHGSLAFRYGVDLRVSCTVYLALI